MKPLVIPPAAQRDPNSVQMLSAWIAERGLHCTLNVGMWQAAGTPETRAWGILLADTIRHLASALAQEHGHPEPETVSEVLDSLHRELGEPTSQVSGGFSVGHT